MDCFDESEGKRVHDPLYGRGAAGERVVAVAGPVIVGAGPSGLAVAACLGRMGVPYVLLERSGCMAALWRHRTYDRLRLHLPKRFCELPLMPFPRGFPTYPTKQQFLEYLEEYARAFGVRPVFRQTVVSAEHDGEFWWVSTRGAAEGAAAATVYRCRWLVVATGENAEPVVPEIEGAGLFRGPMMHTSAYRSGEGFAGKRVLVVGCGNSGMEVCLDLCNHNAHPFMVVRDTVHVLPREMLGRSTFGLSMWLLRWLPVQTVDRFLLLVARLMLGDTARMGLTRPSLGPLELKAVSGKTPVLDVGTLAKIKSGNIRVFPAIQHFREYGVEFVDGRTEDFDAVILATGYRSNVPSWLKEKDFFSDKDGLPRKPFPNGWKGERGLYAVGFTKRGILGASMDAVRIADDIVQCWQNLSLPSFGRSNESK